MAKSLEKTYQFKFKESILKFDKHSCDTVLLNTKENFVMPMEKQNFLTTQTLYVLISNIKILKYNVHSKHISGLNTKLYL